MLQIVQLQRAYSCLLRFGHLPKQLQSENRPTVICNTAKKHAPMDKASAGHVGEAPMRASREEGCTLRHTHTKLQPAAVAQKRQKQRLPRSAGRERGGHGRPITSRPGSSSSGARQARTAGKQAVLHAPAFSERRDAGTLGGCEKNYGPASSSRKGKLLALGPGGETTSNTSQLLCVNGRRRRLHCHLSQRPLGNTLGGLRAHSVLHLSQPTAWAARFFS